METMAIDRYITTTYSDATTIAPSATVSPEASTDDTNSTAITTTARPKALETLVVGLWDSNGPVSYAISS